MSLEHPNYMDDSEQPLPTVPSRTSMSNDSPVKSPDLMTVNSTPPSDIPHDLDMDYEEGTSTKQVTSDGQGALSRPNPMRKRDKKKEKNFADASRNAARRLNETEEERKERRLNHSQLMAEQRELETEQERKKRKRSDATRTASKLSADSDDVREEKRHRNAEQKAESKSTDSESLREGLKLLDAAQAQLRRLIEQPEQRASRRAADAARTAIRRSAESENVQDERRAKNSMRTAEARAKETPVAAVDRRQRDVSRKRAVRSAHFGAARQGGPVQQHYAGKMDKQCKDCGAKYFVDECTQLNEYNICCQKGAVKLPLFDDFPPDLRELFEGNGAESKHFREQIRNYNSGLATGSICAKMEDMKGGAYCYKMHGQSYHFIGPLHPNDNEPRTYAQIFIMDTAVAAQELCGRAVNGKCTPDMFHKLMELLKLVNPFVRAYKTMHEKEFEEREKARRDGRAERTVKMTFKIGKGDDHRRYQLPTSDEVAVVFVGDEEEIPGERCVTIEQKGGRLQSLKSYDWQTDPMCYPLLFPTGNFGWNINIPYAKSRGKRDRVTTMEFYRYFLHVRDEFSPLFSGGKLFQQYVVDMWSKVEQNRLDFIRYNQDKLRVDTFKGLEDYVVGEDQGAAGSRIMLPSSHPGSPRHMVQQYQDAMAVVTRFGKPDYFMTVTSNPQWEEIQENLLGSQTASDRPDIVARVFNMKLKAIKNDIMKAKVLGEPVAYIYVVEFQKRGLPHFHLLLIMKACSKPRTAADVNRVISATLPDKDTDPEAFKLVSTLMMHRPCGAQNPQSPCMIRKGECDKGFPKAFRDETSLDLDGFPLYMRPNDGRIVHHPKGDMDNRRVVPYNRFFLLKYRCHINLEVTGTVGSVKYLYKYVYKGTTRLLVRIHTDANGQEHEVHDEINAYLNTRYVCAPEAMHHLLGFAMCGRNFAVIHLKVHLPGRQGIIFNNGEEEEALNEARYRNTTLTAWFHINQECLNEEVANGKLPDSMKDSRNYFYHEMPEHFTFNTSDNSWRPRKISAQSIGRMYFISPRDRERFALRQLLLYTKGATSFDDLKTIKGHKYETYVEAARAAGFLSDDEVIGKTLDDAVNNASPKQIRGLFGILLCYYEINDAESLWEKYIDAMCEDFEHQGHSRAQSESLAYFDIHERMDAMREDLRKWLDLPYAPVDLNAAQIDHQQCERDGDEMRGKLTAEQENVVATALSCLDSRLGGLLFVDGPGGSGKTFVYNCLANIAQGQKKNVLSVAWTGIAASLLPRGQTVSSTFKLNITDGCRTSSLKLQSAAGRAMRDVDLLLWDEAPMSPKAALETVDRFMRDVKGIDLPFGGLTVVAGGDFRQTLPVVDSGGVPEQVANSIKMSKIWPAFKTLRLTSNMRLSAGEAEWRSQLLEIGDGLIGDAQTGEMKVPEEMKSTGDLPTEVFGKLLSNGRQDIDGLSQVAILAPRNKEALDLNNQILEMIPNTPTRTYLSLDERVTDDGAPSTDSMNFTTEFLNRMTPSGLPPHALNLKNGAMVMLLRNLDVKSGLCNGTRLCVIHMNNWTLECAFVNGPRKCETVLIPKIKLYYEKKMPFKMSRFQFPVRLAFAMTINKSQGQTFDRIGLHLEEKIFSHGQLYVALSRTRTKEGLRIHSPAGIMHNIVYKEVL